jgi:hypothetical protein
MQIIEIVTHSPESCPLSNPKNQKIMTSWLENIDALAAKHGVKVLGVWTDRWGHTSWAAYETPSMEAFAKLELEPEFMARATFNNIEKRAVTTAKETLDFFAKYKKLSP